VLIIAGLGNPGARYQDTRHNVGFRAVELLARQLDIPMTRNGFDGLFGMGTVEGQRIMLIQPQTYMNESGRCLKQVTDYYRAEPAQLLVIYDDIDLPAGKLRVRLKGGPGTHNGMRSIVTQLGTQDFPRIRIGVDQPPVKEALVDWVLGRPQGEQAQAIDQALDRAAQAAELFIRQGVQAAMQQYNGKE